MGRREVELARTAALLGTAQTLAGRNVVTPHDAAWDTERGRLRKISRDKAEILTVIQAISPSRIVTNSYK